MLFGKMAVNAYHFFAGRRHVNVNISGILLDECLSHISAQHAAALAMRIEMTLSAVFVVRPAYA